MTSTVLDVTVMLLCVSASVVALGAVADGSPASTPEAAETADLIATETVTVTYASAGGPNGTQTVHATRAELLALLAASDRRSDEAAASTKAFESAAKRAVRHGVGRRVRIDAKVAAETREEPATEPAETSKGSSERGVVEAPGLGPERFGNETEVADGTGVPWRIYREPRGQNQENNEAAAGSNRSEPVTVGSEPPSGAAVSAAVVTHPLPNASDGEKRVEIVVRRW
ncbi:hypothetical protein [Halorubrum sp. PV6]|uniref:DUF7284 family protein n=1 Tax=Halorubrum sp. PV6 TaxID=634157 RepID=UPI000F858A80|nr:hypothetical protein [Halorubrum sp. PV6]AZQ13497.1 hypothetical protein DOS48_00945 [Halorubrum sp. PV6]